MAGAQTQQQLYALRAGGVAGNYLDVLNPSSGTVELVVPIRGAYVAQQGFVGLTHDGQRLLSVTLPVVSFTSRIGEIRQADGFVEQLWATGVKWGRVAIERNPLDGRIYLLCLLAPPFTSQAFLYEYDPQLQTLTVVAPVTGPIAGAYGFAISPAGQAFSFDPLGPGVYSIDLATGVTTWVASLNLPGFTGYPEDAAFDSAGDLWLSYEDTWTNAETGIYKIDMATLGHTKIISLTSPYYGLAFGPVPTLTSYCTAKLSSQGCVPSIAALGYPCAVALKGLKISAFNVPNQELGLLMYSTTGPQSVPFQGGTLCLKTPVHRTPTSSSGGNASPANDCSGSMTLDFNEYLHDSGASHSPPGPPLPPGTNVCAQWWGRDSGFSAPSNSSLSNAIRFDLAP